MKILDGLLQRTKLDKLPADPLERLKLLHRAIVSQIPFENIAVLEGKPISLELSDLSEKIIRQGRGGYCFELNFLFAAALEELEYQFERLIGRVWVGGRPDPAITHMALRVTINGLQYLCDVGFGAYGLQEPMPWQLGQVTEQLPDRFKLSLTESGELQFSGLVDGNWIRLYNLLVCPVQPQDYLPANHYTSTHPNSHFTRSPLVAVRTNGGRLTLREKTFRQVVDGVETIEELIDYEQFAQVLEDRFHLNNIDHTALQKRLGWMFESKLNS